jgi:hypothetical protein
MRRPPDRKFVVLAALLLAAAASACLQRPAPASAEPVSVALKLLGRS